MRSKQLPKKTGYKSDAEFCRACDMKKQNWKSFVNRKGKGKSIEKITEVTGLIFVDDFFTPNHLSSNKGRNKDEAEYYINIAIEALTMAKEMEYHTEMTEKFIEQIKFDALYSDMRFIIASNE